ncbi:unnamed protein product [Urochloa humidicola]
MGVEGQHLPLRGGMDISIKSQFAWIIKWRRHGVERRVRPLTTRWERQRSAEDLGAIVAPIPNECSAMAFLDEITRVAGAGTDFAAFLQHISVPSLDMSYGLF